MEDDVSARRVRRADPGGRLTGDGVDQDGRADLAVGRRGADADYRLGLSARRPEAYGLMALEIAYFAWVRERMGVAGEVVELPGEVADVAALLAWLGARDDRGASAFAEPDRIRAASDGRSEERSVGKECGSTCRSRGSLYL